jgi:hypothetical protein
MAGVPPETLVINNGIVGNEPTEGGQGVGEMSPSVSVYMPFNVELADLEAELFGQAVDLSGMEIVVTDPIPANVLYDASGATAETAEAWLHFLQAADENTFEVFVNRSKVADVSGAFAAALHIEEGEEYSPANKGVAHLDASGAFGAEVGDVWYNYNSLQDFLMGYFAKKILGHPGALAAISNDSALRAQYTTKYNEGMDALYGAPDAAFLEIPSVLDDPSGLAAKIALAPLVENGLSSDDLHLIVQQMMNQAPDRFAAIGDRGTLAPVQWKEDDKIYIQLHLTRNKYKLNQTPAVGTGHTVLLNAQNSNVITPSTTQTIEDDYYVLVFTVGPPVYA